MEYDEVHHRIWDHLVARTVTPCAEHSTLWLSIETPLLPRLSAHEPPPRAPLAPPLREASNLYHSSSWDPPPLLRAPAPPLHGEEQQTNIIRASRQINKPLLTQRRVSLYATWSTGWINFSTGETVAGPNPPQTGLPAFQRTHLRKFDWRQKCWIQNLSATVCSLRNKG